MLLLAPPGAGKGTQGERLAAWLGVRHIAAGDLLRAEAQAGTARGREIAACQARGDLVPDQIVFGLLIPVVVEAAARGGYILDGFPRTLAQATAAAELGARLDVTLQAVVCLSAPEAVLTRRLLARAGQEGRADDTADVIQHRLQVFTETTGPLIAYYQERGILVTVDADQPPDAVTSEIQHRLSGLSLAPRGGLIRRGRTASRPVSLPLRNLAGVCENPQVDMDRPAVAELMSEAAAAVTRRVAVVREDVYETIVREIPQLRDDKPVLALLASSVDSNVDTCLQIMQHRIDLSDVPAPAAAVEYARRLAQRGTPLTALLRAYRVGHACFADWVLKELAQQAADAETVSAAMLSMSRMVAGYIDHISEQMVDAYGQEREIWLRNRSAARGARIRGLLSGERIDVSAAEATLGYRLRQYHVGVVCWAGDAAGTTEEITRLDRAISHVAGQSACHGDPLFLPRDESSAWAWLPLGSRDGFDAAVADKAEMDDDIHFAFGDAAKGTKGFRVTHQQAIAAQAVALASGSPAPRAVTFSQVAPVAMMLTSRELLRPWVLSTLAGLATDDEHHARLRETLLVFLQSGGSYKTTAEQLMLHKNTVQYRVRKAQESIGRPVGDNRGDTELALRASHWLGSSVLGPATASDV
ncbi:MAG TPA: adenylate kinase [Trebonia sp.]|nr:adenylate kinase [Trebonia sp.]